MTNLQHLHLCNRSPMFRIIYHISKQHVYLHIGRRTSLYVTILFEWNTVVLWHIFSKIQWVWYFCCVFCFLKEKAWCQKWTLEYWIFVSRDKSLVWEYTVYKNVRKCVCVGQWMWVHFVIILFTKNFCMCVRVRAHARAYPCFPGDNSETDRLISTKLSRRIEHY